MLSNRNNLSVTEVFERNLVNVSPNKKNLEIIPYQIFFLNKYSVDTNSGMQLKFTEAFSTYLLDFVGHNGLVHWGSVQAKVNNTRCYHPS